MLEIPHSFVHVFCIDDKELPAFVYYYFWRVSEGQGRIWHPNPLPTLILCPALDQINIFDRLVILLSHVSFHSPFDKSLSCAVLKFENLQPGG